MKQMNLFVHYLKRQKRKSCTTCSVFSVAKLMMNCLKSSMTIYGNSEPFIMA